MYNKDIVKKLILFLVFPVVIYFLISCECDYKLLKNVVSLSAGGGHTCAVLSNGRVLCWSIDSSCKIGEGSYNDYPFAVYIKGIDNAIRVSAKGENPKSHNDDSHFACALLSDHRIKCWGDNSFGQLGDGTTNSTNTPVLVKGIDNAIDVATGGGYTCVLIENGGVKCWGYNKYGVLGDGTRENKLTPVDVAGLTSNVEKIRAGSSHTCAILSDGRAKCWGSNGSGQLGDGTREDRLTPVDIVGLESKVKDISIGPSHTCAVLENGAAKCWGKVDLGSLGAGEDVLQSDTPVDVIGLNKGVVRIEAGCHHTCALLESGKVKCWGNNEVCQMGIGYCSWTRYYSPVSASISYVKDITAGVNHNCALMNDSGVKCWGGGSDGYGDKPVDIKICE